MNNLGERSPLPRPLPERFDLPEDQHMSFWLLILREYPSGEVWKTVRRQSIDLYRNYR